MRRTVLAVLAVLAASAAVPALPAQAVARPAPTFRAHLQGDFAGVVCPADAPAGALCVLDEVRGTATRLGRVTGSFEVVFDLASFGADSCGPITKQGRLRTVRGDSVEIDAVGTFCFDTAVAEYTYRLGDGTGRLAGLEGSGRWDVPAPDTFDAATSSGTGAEELVGTLQRVRTRR